MALHKHRIVGAVMAIALLGSAATVALAGTATAAPVQTTTTALTTSTPDVVSANPGDPGFVPQSATLTATVTAKPIGGLLVTPGGKITFTATDSNGDTLNLGSANLGACLLTIIKCTAKVTSNAFYVASDEADQTAGSTTWFVTASYPGQTLLNISLAGSSSGAVEVTAVTGQSTSCNEANGCYLYVQNSDDSASVTLYVACTTGCEEDSVRQPANTSNATLNAANSTTPYEVYAGFGSPEMTDCAGGNTPLDSMGVSQNNFVYFPAADVSASNLANITYQLYGSSADAQGTSEDPTSFCYGSTTEFTQADGSAAPFNATNSQYEGILPACGDPGVTTPCWTDEFYDLGFDGGPSTWSITVQTATDPAGGKH
jgi:hypothetical protein